MYLEDAIYIIQYLIMVTVDMIRFIDVDETKYRFFDISVLELGRYRHRVLGISDTSQYRAVSYSPDTSPGIEPIPGGVIRVYIRRQTVSMPLI